MTGFCPSARPGELQVGTKWRRRRVWPPAPCYNGGMSDRQSIIQGIWALSMLALGSGFLILRADWDSGWRLAGMAAAATFFVAATIAFSIELVRRHYDRP